MSSLDRAIRAANEVMFEALSRITILIDGRKAYVDCCSHPVGAVSQLMAKYPPEDASLILAETIGEDGPHLCSLTYCTFSPVCAGRYATTDQPCNERVSRRVRSSEIRCTTVPFDSMLNHLRPGGNALRIGTNRAAAWRISACAGDVA